MSVLDAALGLVSNSDGPRTTRRLDLEWGSDEWRANYMHVGPDNAAELAEAGRLTPREATIVSFTTLLFDFDHTLFDSNESEALAFADTIQFCEIPKDPTHFDTYKRINKALWDQVELGTISPNDLRTQRFVEFVTEIGFDVDPQCHGGPVRVRHGCQWRALSGRPRCARTIG